MNRAVEELAKKASANSGRGGAAKVLKELGDHPDSGGHHYRDGLQAL